MGALVLVGCATPQPVLNQKQAASAARQQRAANDSQECRRLAEATVGLNACRADTTTRSAARSGAVAGAAVAVVKTLLEWNDPETVNQVCVERCMDERGHDVLGWRWQHN